MNSHNSTVESKFDEKELGGPNILSNVATMIIVPIAGTLNILVIIALLKYVTRKLRDEATTKLILNLAISDLIFSTIALPIDRLQSIISDYSTANSICKLNTTIFYWTFFVTLLTLASISINRLILIVYNPIYHKVYTKLNIILMVSSAWILSLALALIPYFEIWGVYKLDYKKRSWCGIRRSDETKFNSWPRDYFFILGFTLPGVTMIITYALIWFKVMKQSNNFRTNKSTERNFKLFKLIVIIFSAFMICYFPNLLIRAIMKQRGYGYVKAVGIILIWCNSCINPIIYFTFNQEYRYALERMLGFQLTWKRSQPPQSSEHTSESAVSNSGNRVNPTQAKSTV